MAFNDDEAPASTTNIGKTKGLVTIKPMKYFKDDAALTADTVTAEVEINATSSTTVREGLDLVAVLDVSGSMRGEKIESLKKAMKFVIQKLTPVDRLSIVTFSSDAKRLSPLRSMTPAAQNDLKAVVDGLHAGGLTNIEAGLETGLTVIAGRVNTNARTANIFLMSDGEQNPGDARKVDPGQVAIYTFGFGSGTDHKLMSDIARNSAGGTFSNLPDGSKVSLPFSQLLAGLLTVVAQDVELTLTPNTEAGDVDTIEVAPGIDYTTIPKGPSSGMITIKFGTLFAGEGRRVVITLKLKDVSDTYKEDYDANLGEAQHSFTAQARPRDRQVPQDIQIRRTLTPSQAPGTSGKARQLQAEIARRQHADAIRRARELADAGQLVKARGMLEGAQEALDDIVLDDGHNKLVDALRAELLKLIELMDDKELYNSKGLPYALAALTSHDRQRYAARDGDVEAVRLYATARMNAYLEQAKKYEEDPDAPVPSSVEDVKQEVAANPLGAIAGELALALRNAIEALQAVEKMVASST